VSERVLVVDDDARLARMLADYLGQNGFEVTLRGDGAAGLVAAEREAFDAVVLDVMLPDLDGFEVCRRLRARSDVPILMLTARGELTDRVVGLEIGADDYVPKPFEPRELLARLRALVRRRHAASTPGRVLRFGALEVDLGAREARVQGRRRALTAAQFALLVAMAERPGRVLTREQLLDLVGGEHADSFDRAIDVQISRLRAAIEDDPRQPRYVLTVRGTGYLLARSPQGG
jgi:two-component system phosphate regulon response regulator OmpR